MSKFYAVAHGFSRGVYTDWNEAKKQIDDFPQPIYKKFDTEEEAEKYVNDRKPKNVELAFPEPTHDNYYAVARGHVVGVFIDYGDVKKHIADYPQPLHKKFGKLDEAVSYFHKYYNGKGNEGSSDKKQTSDKKNVEKPQAYYAVAKGHETGVFLTWDECKKQTTGFKGAKFKKFDNEQDAQLFAAGKTLKEIEESHAHGSKRKAQDSDGIEKKKKKQI